MIPLWVALHHPDSLIAELFVESRCLEAVRFEYDQVAAAGECLPLRRPQEALAQSLAASGLLYPKRLDLAEPPQVQP